MGSRAHLAVTLPFEGLPAWSQVLFYRAFVLIVAMLIWTPALFIASRRSLRRLPEPDAAAADGFLWVFLVPALDEALTIADSVDSPARASRRATRP